MREIKRTSLLLFLMLLVTLACIMPELPPTDQSASETSVAQTVLAAVVGTQRAMTASVPSDMLSSSASVPSESQTESPTPSLTPTETLTPIPAFTATSLIPRISVSVPTNCRVGPGKVYEMVGALLVDETAQVYGRDPTGDYWYIRNPDETNGFCWVWGEYATLSGPVFLLPVYTPPPTPTPTLTSTPAPGFDASYQGLDSCTGWWAEIKLKNTGTINFHSAGITLKDTVTSDQVSNIADGFINDSGCTSSSSKASLQEGKSVTVSSPSFAYDPSGHKLRATITLCSETGLNGTCVTETITFKP